MSSVKKNFTYNFIYQILIMFLPLLTTPYLSRVLGAEGLGVYSYTYSIASYFIIFAMLGLNNYGNRKIARIRDNKDELSKTFWEIYGMQLFTSFVVLVIYFFYTGLFSNNKLYSLIQGCIIISTMFDINWFFFGIEEFRLTVIRNIIIKILTISFIFIFVKNKGDIKLYILIMAIGTLISQIVLWPLLFKRIAFIKPKLKNIMAHFFQNLILFIPVIAVSLYRILDKVMLGYMTNMSQVGFYDNSEKIISIPMGAITALGTVMLPRISNLIASGKIKESNEMIEKSMLFIMIFGSAFMFGILGISNTLAPVFFGQEFKDCDILINLLTITIIFICWANIIRTQYLIPCNKDKIYVVTVIIGAVINIFINLILIPILGATGAAIGTITAEVFVCISQTYLVRKELTIKKYFYNGFPFLFMGVAMYLVVKLLELNNIISVRLLILQILIGGATYLAFVLIYYKISKNLLTKNMIKAILFLNKHSKTTTKTDKINNNV